jgi:hypothetical protein
LKLAGPVLRQCSFSVAVSVQYGENPPQNLEDVFVTGLPNPVNFAYPSILLINAHILPTNIIGISRGTAANHYQCAIGDDFRAWLSQLGLEIKTNLEEGQLKVVLLDEHNSIINALVVGDNGPGMERQSIMQIHSLRYQSEHYPKDRLLQHLVEDTGSQRYCIQLI